jgi:hypothetical protein
MQSDHSMLPEGVSILNNIYTPGGFSSELVNYNEDGVSFVH